MVVRTHVATSNEERVDVGSCECLSCENRFFVIAAWEMVPNLCPYCGVRFGGFIDANGDVRNKVGMEVQLEGLGHRA